MDEASTYNDGNGKGYIKAHDGSNVQEDATWGKLGAPVHFPSGFDIKAEVTIKAGNSFLMGSGAKLGIDGSVIANGTTENPIKFIGEESTEGYWQGMRIRSNGSAFNYVEFMHGGSDDSWDDNTTVILKNSENASASFENCSFSQGSGYGLKIYDRKINGFSNNTFEENGASGLFIHPNKVSELDSASTYNKNNESPYILLFGGKNVNDNGRWAQFDAPIKVSGKGTIKGDLTIAAGNTLEFTSSAQWSISGSLKAVGEPGNRIVFTAVEKIKGYWEGLEFQSNTAKNQLQYVEVGYGGAEDAWWIKKNIGVADNARLELKNAEVHNSGGYGMVIRSNASLTPTDPLSIASNNFHDNESGKIKDKR